jgi:hypothetical protein
MSEIEKIYNLALFSNKYKIIDIGILNADTIIRIKKAVNVDLQGYKICIDTNSIKHILKQHGNPIKEAQHGQIAVTNSDFEKISSIINNPDKIMKGNINNTIKFIKRIGYKYFVIEEVKTHLNNKKNRIILKTMYIKKA